MAEKSEKEALTNADWVAVGDYVHQELQRRKSKRATLEQQWAEVDRQVAMTPIAREVKSGDRKDWFPDMELPLQFNALEVIAADARRLKFPRGSEWFSVSAELSDEYMDRFQKLRDRRPLVSAGAVDGDPQQIILDQETGNTLIKVVLDHYHKLYDFRSAIDLFDVEAIKYGTSVARVRPINALNFGYDFRGNQNPSQIGPAVIASSIKNTYLDDLAAVVLHEGISTPPSVIRTYTQRKESLIKAAKKFGGERGWILNQIRKLEPRGDEHARANIIELAEFEGDLIVPQSRGSIFLPNVLVTVALNSGIPRPVRFREIKNRTYVVGHYMRDDLESPYGSSPLMKGQPIQEAATEVFNDMLAVARLNADPPMVWDSNDPQLVADKGPGIYPGAIFPTDSPNAVEVLEVGDLGELMNVYLALLKQYEDLTGANDPRRGEAARSHTTATSSELESARGLARTDDFVAAQEKGPITTMLYMEYEIIKEHMRKVTPVSVESGGIEGWINVAADDLADRATFHVQGSAGVVSERERARNFVEASQFAVTLAQAAAQFGTSIPINFEEIIVEIYNRAGVQNAARFVGGAEGLPPQPQDGSAVPGANGGASPVQLAALQALSGGRGI